MFGWILVVAVAIGIAWPVLRDRGLLTRIGVAPKSAQAPDDKNDGLYRREELCHQCSRVNPAGRKTCFECGAVMPVENVKDLWQGSEKEGLIREAIQCAILLAVMLVAMGLSYNLPLTGKLIVLTLTIAGLSWRLLRVVQES